MHEEYSEAGKLNKEKKDQQSVRWAVIGFIAVIAFQIGIYSLRVNDRFYDGRFHINWGPPFWLMHAQQMHRVSFVKSYFGVVSGTTSTPSGMIAEGFYSSHPQFIAIPLYLWTGAFGFSEAAVRTLPALATIVTIAMLWFALRERNGKWFSLVAVATAATFPIVMLYGRKLDQEPFVLFFLSLAFLAHEKYARGGMWWRFMWGGAMLGLVWSDYSGWIFVALFAAAQGIVALKHIETRKLFWWTLGGGAFGAAIVVIQTILETRATGGKISGLFDLYKYRSNTKYPNFWYQWMRRYFGFLRLNYGYAGYAGLTVFLIAAGHRYARGRIVNLKKNGLTLFDLCGLVGFGTIIYAFLVPQATFIHLYYQYYYLLPFAYGLTIGLQWIYRRARRDYVYAYVAGGLALLILTLNSYEGFKNIYDDIRQGFGARSDIDLIMKFRDADESVSLAAIGPPAMGSWYDNPNIRYYAHRPIKFYEPKPAAEYEWIFAPAPDREYAGNLLNNVAIKNTKFEVTACSANLCLFHRVNK